MLGLCGVHSELLCGRGRFPPIIVGVPKEVQPCSVALVDPHHTSEIMRLRHRRRARGCHELPVVFLLKCKHVR